MQTVELFCGTKSFSNFAASLGHATFTVDLDPQHEPTLISDITALRPKVLPSAEILWASPPCEAFSVAAIGKNWYRNGTPKHPRAVMAQQLVRKTVSIIRRAQPEWWFIENPRGMLRTLDWFENVVHKIGGVRHTVTYCQYGERRLKPTDIWTNASWWRPRSPCVNGAPCHDAAPRGSRTGTQGIVSRINRARIPNALFEELFSTFATQSKRAA